MLRLAALTVLALLVPVAAALGAARPATTAESRGIRAAAARECPLVAKFTEVAVSKADPRFAILNYDATNLTDVCTAIVRRRSRTARAWRVVEVTHGLETTERAISPCPRVLPRDLRRTVKVRGARGPIVYCGN